MKFKMKFKKDIFLKKSTWLVLALFAITAFNIPRFIAKAGATGDAFSDSDKIKILEISAGNKFKLTNTQTNPPREEYLETAAGVKTKVTHISMPEYISMVDDIAGKYDAVVITRQSSSTMHGSYYTRKVDGDIRYRDFTAPQAQPLGVYKYLAPADWKLSSATYVPVINGQNVSEYYSENDITEKRAKEIIKMVDNGQLVYIDAGITTDASLATSNLFKIFNYSAKIGSEMKSKENSNLFKKANSEITIDNVVNYYKGMPINSKRPIISAATLPVDEVKNTDGTVTNQREMNFNITANSGIDNEDLTFNLYLDFDGSGTYSTKELVKTYNFTGSVNSKSYSFACQLDNVFMGILDWKVEIVRPNGVKSNVTGNTKFVNQSTKKRDIKVLQIYPDNGDINTRLSENKIFNAKLDSTELSDYNITVDDIKVSDFCNTYGTKIDSATGKPTTLEGKYDMVIVGFADNYGNCDFTSNAAMADLDNFIKKNHSVMFTHDTMALSLYNGDSKNGPAMLTRHYRDYVGQARYKDPYSTKQDTSKQFDSDGNLLNIYQQYDANGSLAYLPIPHNTISGTSLGITPLTANSETQDSKDDTGLNLWNRTYTKQVKSVNDAQITEYPFDLRNVNAGAPGVVNVSLTHTQWFQLDLEDPDVVPWYNLLDGDINSGDSRNFYYTYSKGNITYSGTGHSGTGDVEQEVKLFINTIIKAVRGANTPPTVTNEKFSDKSVIADKSTVNEKLNVDADEYKFITIPTDVDNDKLHVIVTVKPDSKEQSTVLDKTGVVSGTSLNVSIPKSVYANLPVGTNLNVEVKVIDPSEASDTKTFILQTNHAPTIANQQSLTAGDIPDKGNVIASKEQDFVFYTIPSDVDVADKDSLALSAKVRESDISDLTIDAKTFDKTKVKTGSKVKVVIPKSTFADCKSGDKITITTGVTDSEKVNTTKSFTVTIQDPEVTHGVWKVDSTSAGGHISNDVVDTTLIQANETPQFVGKITKVYNTSAVVKLTVDSKLQLAGDKKVWLYRVSGGNETKVGEMLKDGTTNCYTYDLANSSLSTVEPEGMTFIVKYSAGLIALPQGIQETPESYTNTITVDTGKGAVTIYYKKIKADDRDLF